MSPLRASAAAAAAAAVKCNEKPFRRTHGRAMNGAIIRDGQWYSNAGLNYCRMSSSRCLLCIRIMVAVIGWTIGVSKVCNVFVSVLLLFIP